jgi:hypothetical protein
VTYSRKVFFLIILIFISISLSAVNVGTNRDNILLNYQIFLQNETFPKEYLLSQRDNLYQPDMDSFYYRTSEPNEEPVYAPIAVIDYSYSDDGKLLSTSNYNQHAGGQIILYSIYNYDYEDDLLRTIALESYEEFEILMNTTYHNYYYDDNNLIDFISKTMEDEVVFEIEDYTFNDNDLIARIDYFDGNNEYISTSIIDYMLFEYDDYSRLSSVKSCKIYPDNHVAIRSQSYFSYNSHGNITSIVIGDSTSYNYNVHEYSYDENNLLTKIDHYSVAGQEYSLVYYLEMINDENGNKCRENTYSYASDSDIPYCSSYITTSYLAFVPNNNVEINPDTNLRNYPNPFNPVTTISFNLQALNNPSLTVYNLKGQLVKSFKSHNYHLGENKVIWDGKDNNGKNVASGLYFYHLKTDSFTKTNKMILMK